MTQINSSKRLENDLLLLEKGDKSHPFDIPFIIKLTISESSEFCDSFHSAFLTENDLDKLSDIIYDIVAHDITINNKPSSVYISLNVIILIFSTKVNYTKTYDSMISEYIQLFFETIHEFYLKNKGITLQNIEGRVVHFPTQIHIIAYIAQLIVNNSYNYMKSVSNGTITTKDIQFYTNDELESKLKTMCQIEWNNLSYKGKYGIIFKIDRTLLASDKYIRKKEALSELIDVKNIQKYTNFIF
jgi:hypothetical protein